MTVPRRSDLAPIVLRSSRTLKYYLFGIVVLEAIRLSRLFI